MNDTPLSKLTIRTAMVRTPEVGYIYACDLEKERDEIPHAITFKWNLGRFTEGKCNYDAHTICIAEFPITCLVDASEAGFYSIVSSKGNISGNILDDSSPKPEAPRFGGFRSITEIEGRAYAVGLRGMVYRLDKLKKWTRIDDGLPDNFNIQAIHGFNSNDIYAVGRDGELWRYDGNRWTKYQLPTNANLTSVKCAANGKVYVGGHDGMLICGRMDIWDVVDHGETENDIWDLEWFKGQLYVSTMHSVYRLNNQKLEQIDFGKVTPKAVISLVLLMVFCGQMENTI